MIAEITAIFAGLNLLVSALEKLIIRLIRRRQNPSNIEEESNDCPESPHRASREIHITVSPPGTPTQNRNAQIITLEVPE